MGNDDLKNALMRAQGVQGFMGGGMATHAMPDGTVMPGATHGQYQAMGYQEGGPARRGSETGAVINDAELRRQLEQMTGSETGAVINDRQKQNFINALLAKETGAVIKDSEMAWANQTYFPQMGDSPQTIELKRQAREQAIQQMEQDGTPQGAGFGQRMRQSLGSETGAVINDAELRRQLEQMTGSETGAVINDRQKQPAQELQEALQGLQIQKSQAKDPSEIQLIEKMIENISISANAPYSDLMQKISGTAGEDDMMAHVRSGDVNVSKEMILKNPNIEKEIEKTSIEMGLDPEEMVFGTGLASLNTLTGMEQHGFFKKIGKAIKNVAKFIAPIAGPLANFIPGVGPLVAGAIGAATNVVGGKGLSGAISGGLGGYGFGKALGGIGSLAGGTAKEFAQKGFGAKLSALGKGLGSLPGEGFFGTAKELLMPGVDKVGLFGNFGKAAGYMMGPARGMPGNPVTAGGGSSINPFSTTGGTATTGGTSFNEPFVGADFSPEAAARGMYPTSNVGGGSSINPFSPVGGGPSFGNAFSGVDMAALEAGNAASNTGFKLSDIYSGTGINDDGKYGFLGDLGAKLVGGGSTSGGLGGLGGLAAAGVPAYLLGKMAYDEAKADKGVALTPLTTMGPTGRYNIEAEIARRMGTQAPNPVEFGLLPQGTFPQLSGGQPMMAAGGGAVYPMAYAEGGNVSVEDFERMNGDINGPGTETSDDVPAMLSDGEFVMTGAAVRGAGGFDMQNQGGILTLTPSGTPDRERGTNVMHEMMDLFGSYANAPA